MLKWPKKTDFFEPEKAVFFCCPSIVKINSYTKVAYCQKTKINKKSTQMYRIKFKNRALKSHFGHTWKAKRHLIWIRHYKNWPKNSAKRPTKNRGRPPGGHNCQPSSCQPIDFRVRYNCQGQSGKWFGTEAWQKKSNKKLFNWLLYSRQKTFIR